MGGRFTKEYLALLMNSPDDVYGGTGQNKGPERVDNGKKMPLENQVGGKYYKQYAIQPIVFITANKLGFIEGCVIKYICRYASKGGSEDLRKIKHYVDLLLWLKYKETDINKPMNREELYAKLVDSASIADREGKNDTT